ncbi:MAG: TetR/AcrR family transcriptional regulator [Gammaproteobacteria bacterium]|nr:TetR/AcrR family transcriptional regulator [Gammaproteobacteria bacterium]
MNDSLSRKQREIRQREGEILNHAEKLLHDHGFHGVTMERLAELTACSRGTIYQHFTNKEDLCAAVCLDNSSQLVELFQRAVTFDGESREQIVAIAIAHWLFVSLNPTRFRNFQSIMSSAFREKLPAERETQLFQREETLFKLVTRPVQKAVDDGKLVLHQFHSVAEVVMSLWAHSFGHLYLLTTHIPFQDLGVEAPKGVLFKSSHTFLDGLGWQPLAADFDYRSTFERLQQELFAPEFTALHPPQTAQR